MKIIGKFFILFMIAIPLFALEAHLSKYTINNGEAVTLYISVSGSDVKEPEISSIGGYEITNRGSSQNISSINGNLSMTKEFSYTFYPDKNITIEPIKIEVDGKDAYTPKLSLTVKQMKFDNIKLTSKVNNTSLYFGQNIIVELEINYNRREIYDLAMQRPNFENFYVKDVKQAKPSQVGDTVSQKIYYYLLPKKTGIFDIKPFVLQVVESSSPRDIFGRAKSLKISSNSIKLEIKPLPNNAKLIGNFWIKAKVDKEKVKAYEPINYEIKIGGNGNFENLEAIKLEAGNAVVFADKPQINEVNNEQIWTQKFALNSDSNFTIEPVGINFFDLENNKTKSISTESFDITVDSSFVVKRQEKIEPKIIVKEKINYTISILAFAFGLILGVLLVFGFKNFKLLIPEKKDLLKDIILHYGKDKELDEWIEKIEENRKLNKKHKIDKKAIKKLITNLKA